MDLEVENPKATADQPKSKHYYSAYLGEHSKNADALNRAFAPASIAGRTTYSETVRFYPAGNPLPKLVDEAGEYRFTLTLNLAEAAEAGFWDSIWRPRIAPLKFALNLPWISEQQLGFRRLAIAMHAKDYKPISAGQTASK